MYQFKSIILSLSSLIFLGACSSGGGGGSSSPSAVDALVLSTSPDTAKDILSRYGYSVEEFWRIVDEARVSTGGDLNFMFADSELKNLTANCSAVYSESANGETISLVNSSTGTCQLSFLYQRTISGDPSNQSYSVKYMMKLKNPQDNPAFNFNSVDCIGSGSGSQSSTDATVSFGLSCKAIDNHYGQFDSSFSGHIIVTNGQVSMNTKATVVTPGIPEKGMLGGAAQIIYVWDMGANKTSYTFNGQKTVSIESPGWMPGLRVN